MNSLTAYDVVPYKSHPFAQTHPDRLATIGLLFGLCPPPPTHCRFLELGCASGGNLIPMAVQYPNSHFVGIDASKTQIEIGQNAISELQLKNIDLRWQDIRNFPDSETAFDYIVTHGVYSWVPNDVQSQILRISRQQLTQNGIAYISYNTYPGWHLRGMIRDIMRFRAKSFESPEQRLSQARSLLVFLTNSVRGEKDPYGILLRQELESIGRADDSYLHHEHLEETNSPIYFHQFAERASAAGLQYLGEADFGIMAIANFPENVRVMLQSVSRDQIELEQYMDFLRNRGFRQTLLCRDDVVVKRHCGETRLAKLRVASPATPEKEPIELSSSEPTIYRRRGATLSTNNPVVRAAFQELRRAWPRSILFSELASIAKSTVTGRPAAVDADVMGTSSQQLAESIYRCFETSMVDLGHESQAFNTDVSERPLASPLARLQAKSSSIVTCLKHESVTLDDMQRQTLMALDGENDLGAIQRILAGRIANGELVVFQNQKKLASESEANQVVEQNLASVLQSLAGMALLIR